ncbi:MAG TPA: hypothetical protein VFM18_16095 [Methanosarcina sp.]|nr:hypothetical protein [Methanosarcina sp.]
MSDPTAFIPLVIKMFTKSIPSLIGSILAVLTMKFDESTPLSKRITAGVIAFISGIAISHYIGNAIISYYPVTDPMTQDAIKFCLGIFGLTLINNILAEINPWISAFRNKILGS